jgi:transposase
MHKNKVQAAPIKYCTGIDVSKDSLSVCFAQLDNQQHVSIKGTRTFGNQSRGWKALESWIQRFHKQAELPLSIVMEATGVYYEGCAFYFKNQGFEVSVVLPNRSKNYARSLNIKSKTDEVDARVLAQMGLERALPVWKGVNGTLRTLKRLCREQEALQQMRTVVMNQLHAHVHSHEAEKSIVKRFQQHIRFIEKQIKTIQQEIQKVCTQDAELQKRIDNICSVKGLGLLTVATVIAETNGFDLIENKGQVVSFAGYDVVENQSGTSLHGKTRISKKGNSHIRRALHFPAMTAAQHEPKFKMLYERICEKNPKAKMIGLVAVQRKLLVLIYTLYKKNEPYDPNFETTKATNNTKKVGKTSALPTQHRSQKAACFV